MAITGSGSATLGEPDPTQPIAGLNRVLSEIVDVILEVKVALWRSKRTGGLHTELDQLLCDLRGWMTSLGDRDMILGVSPLSFMTSVAGREGPTLWRGDPTESEACSLVGDLLRDMNNHVAAVLRNSLTVCLARFSPMCTSNSSVISRCSRDFACRAPRHQQLDRSRSPVAGDLIGPLDHDVLLSANQEAQLTPG